MKYISVALDGPSGAGKSTLAKSVSAKLGYLYVDTGAIYRTIGYYAFTHGIDPKNEEAVTASLPAIDVQMVYGEDGLQHMLLNGKDVTKEIRLPEISMYASAVSKIPEVREKLLGLQKDLAAKGGVIMDGRDIGTVIIPDAELKVFMTATLAERARRRYKELCEKDMETTYEEVLADMEARDKNDRERESAPCVPAEDAVQFVNDGYNVEESAEYIIALAEKKAAELQ